MHPAPQREPLAAGVGDGVAEPRVAQELRVGLGEVVAAVGLQGAHGLLEPRAEEDAVRGPLADEGLLLVELPRGDLPRGRSRTAPLL